jgi:hypothetical protein
MACVALLSVAAGCGSPRQAAGSAMVVTGAVVAGSALATSTEPVLLSDDVGTAQIAYVSREGFDTTDAALITGGAALMAVGQALLQTAATLPPVQTAPQVAAPQAPQPHAPSAPGPAARVTDPAAIKAACESVLQ